MCNSFELEMGEYETRSPTTTSNRECAPLTVCNSNGITKINATAISDRTCECAGEYWGDVRHVRRGLCAKALSLRLVVRDT